MWIVKILLVALILEVFSVLAVPAPKRPSSLHGGTGSGSHSSIGSHGGTGASIGSSIGTGIGSNIGTGSHSKPKPSTNADRNSDCKLIFNIGQTSDGKPTVTSIKMPELARMLNAQGTGTTRDNICNSIFALNPTFISQDKPSKPGYLPSKPTIEHGKEEQARSTHSPNASTVSSAETKKEDIEKLVYEDQLTVWPTDIEEVLDTLRPGEQHSIGYPAWSTIDASHVMPLYEDQIVVFPELQFDDLDTEYDEEDDEQDSWPIVSKPPTSSPAQEDIKVLENFNLMHLNGTSEHKLVLSNGMVNYKKIYNKLVDGKNIMVQEGYDSVPIPGTHNTEFNTQFYIADEHGHNVYKIEHNMRRPDLPVFLSYREQMAAAKRGGSL